ncbi:phosphoribosyltransferase [Apibacter muscae]|uniref:Phosphoribosyltransferase n=1 Tax=Apibacter muscae TaxID=2509004 RepID=A0A563DDK5_9FLAO|nr:phosphoribosyltransferase [Apibacter muscae]
MNHLKNQFGNTSTEVLKKGIENLKKILEEDLPKIRNICNTDFIVCVIPRAKAEGEYSDDQKLFKTVISNVVNKLSGYSNGTTYIIRHTNTRTTHMNRSGYGGDGKMPYPGITKDTCSISNDVIGKDILLIDDLYTKTINIDEDAIQALLDKGAKSVVFYSIGKTVSKY